jgi:hypothetical protein
MADRRPPAETTGADGDDRGTRPNPQRPGTPRWVLAFGVVALILLIVIAVQLLLGVQHGPGMHSP